MTTHPNRSKTPREGRNPSPAEIIEVRTRAGLTMPEAANLVYKTLSSWRKYEAGIRRMNPDTWELFNIKINKGETKMATLYEVMDGIFDSAQREYFDENFGSLAGIMQYADGALDSPITPDEAARIKAAGEHYLKSIEDGGFHHEAWSEAREMLED